MRKIVLKLTIPEQDISLSLSLSLTHTHTHTYTHTHTHTHTHKMYLDIDLTPSTKINSKWITNLNVKCKTTELIDDNLGENRNDLGYGNEFLDIAPKAQFIREITDTLNFIKIKKKKTCFAKDTAKRMRR